MDKYEYNPETDVAEWTLNSVAVLIAGTALLGPLGTALAYGYMFAAVHPEARITRIPETMRLHNAKYPTLDVRQQADAEREWKRINTLIAGSKFDGNPTHQASCIRALKEVGIEVKKI